MTINRSAFGLSCFRFSPVVDLRGTVVLRSGHARHVDPSGVGIEWPEFGPRWVRTSIQMILWKEVRRQAMRPHHVNNLPQEVRMRHAATARLIRYLS